MKSAAISRRIATPRVISDQWLIARARPSPPFPPNRDGASEKRSLYSNDDSVLAADGEMGQANVVVRAAADRHALARERDVERGAVGKE